MSDQAEKKKMGLTQLTFLVAVSMMGSGIIMLPSNMAEVGGISLLSWVITALGSMAIAYGFGQAGILDRTAGGLPAYAEAAYGRAGFFVTFSTYYLSLIIANVAMAISAVGYAANFFPFMESTPIMICLTVLAFVWVTTIANFWGPGVTGKIGSITVWGVVLPVGGLSVIGWLWFSPTTFGEAWNPNGVSIFEGMGSSITLTLWAFLGMETAAQNGGSVENPRRNVPLACMLGTLGAAVIYVLSTTVIMGIVPNAELAKSTGPFGLVFEQMFSPLVGQIVMALAVMACLGSLLSWQFTLAQTGKTAAEQKFLPQIMGKENKWGAPIAGMIIITGVQSLFALSTISPTINEQFNLLVDLSVVTNVIPYILALSGLMVMMRLADVEEAAYKRNALIAGVAMLYSTYALYASGATAVIGGMVVMALAWMLYGYLAPGILGTQPQPTAAETEPAAANVAA